MDSDKLKDILEKHRKWLNGEKGAERADLRGANLQGADLQGADLQVADLRDADLQVADLRRADLRGADLQWANLRGADLRDANLQGADLDFSCLPLWCCGSRFKADMKLVRQLLAHICTIEIVDTDDYMKAVIEAIRPEANRSHRAEDLGLLND